MIRDDIKGQLGWIALWANSLADNGQTAVFPTIHSELKRGTIIQWLNDQGADMSIQLATESRELTNATVRILQMMSENLRGRERRKLAVENNGYCLLVGLVLEALAIDQEY